MKEIDKAKTRLMLSHPWLASLMLQAPIVYTEQVPTMGVDGRTLAINPEFVKTLSDSDLVFVLGHEILHLALLHCQRRGSRERMRWNIAADAIVNGIMKEAGFNVPANAVPPSPDLKLTVEEVYNKIPPSRKMPCKYPQDIQDADQTITASDDAQWQMSMAAMAGSMPGNLQRLFQNQEAKRDWREQLARFVATVKVKGSSHSWMRPSRRVPGLPGWNREPTYKLGVCIDVSGSIMGEILNKFIAETKAIAKLNGVEIYGIIGDTRVTKILEPGEDWPDKIPGGGGTDFRPLIKKAEEFHVDGIVFLTDGEGAYPERAPNAPIIWALTAAHPVPFGDTMIL